MNLLQIIKYNIIQQKNFDILYKSIFEFIKDEKCNIYEYIFYPFTSGINYLNYLYELCKVDEHYNKLLNLIINISSKNYNQNRINVGELCIINHINYTFRKMNSTKKKGYDEINYCILLIKNVIPIIIKGKKNEDIIKILNYGYNFSMKNFLKME